MKTLKQNGYSLLELLITIAIVGVLATVAIPNMSSFIKNERLTSQINGLLSHLKYARSEAIFRHTEITVCASKDALTCSGSWNNGWIVHYVDNDGDIVLLKAHAALKGSNTLNAKDDVTSIKYDYRGFTPNSASTFSLCDDRGSDHAKALSISNTGRAAVDKGATVTCS